MFSGFGATEIWWLQAVTAQQRSPWQITTNTHRRSPSNKKTTLIGELLVCQSWDNNNGETDDQRSQMMTQSRISAKLLFPWRMQRLMRSENWFSAASLES